MADVHVNALTPLTAEPSASDSLVAVNRGTNEGMIIDYNLLADVILSKISSKQYDALTTASKLLPGAINELDADAASLAADVADNATAISQLNSRFDDYMPTADFDAFKARLMNTELDSACDIGTFTGMFVVLNTWQSGYTGLPSGLPQGYHMLIQVYEHVVNLGKLDAGRSQFLLSQNGRAYIRHFSYNGTSWGNWYTVSSYSSTTA